LKQNKGCERFLMDVEKIQNYSEQSRYDMPSRKSVLDIETFKSRLRLEEGKGKEGRPGYSYRDTAGHLTIGYGHKIVPGDEKILPKGAIAGRTALTDKQMENLLTRDVGAKLELANRLFPKFNSYNTELKGAIFDGIYRGDLSGSPKTMRLINEGKFALAAKEYLDHDGYRESLEEDTGIHERMERNAAIFKKQQFLRRKK
tara:strand:- start:1174 stop:1776 length:603 start_codon:yes stop_codon:yes gene_type:complete